MGVISDWSFRDEACLLGAYVVNDRGGYAFGDNGREDFVVRVEKCDWAVVTYVSALLFFVNDSDLSLQHGLSELTVRMDLVKDPEEDGS